MSAPGPSGDFLLGIWRHWRHDPLEVLTDSQRRYGDVVRLRFGPKSVYLLTKPEHIRRILVDRYRLYGKKTIGWNRMRVLFGNGLLTNEGDSWLRQRRIAQPAFHSQRIAASGSKATLAAEALLGDWRRRPAPEEPVDMAAEMMRLTMRVVGETLLSSDVTRTADAIGIAVNEVLYQTQARIGNPWLALPLPTQANRRYTAALHDLDQVVLGFIAERRRSGETPADLLSMLMGARDEDTGAAMSDRQLVDEVKTIFLAGIETTSTALSWTWYLLARNPQTHTRLTNELAAQLGGQPARFEDLSRLPLLSSILQESLRLYPPIWIIGRSVDEADEVGGHVLPKGSMVMLSPYVTHRRADLWREPERFDPDRFAEDRSVDLDNFSYFPFGGGPRLCIGNAFALMLARLTLATLAPHIRPELVAGRAVTPDPTITLRPKGGLPLLLRLTPH